MPTEFSRKPKKSPSWEGRKYKTGEPVSQVAHQICVGVYKGLKGVNGWAARKGGEDVRDPKRERRTGESKKSEPRRRRVDLRGPDERFQKDQTPGSGVTFHVLISSSSVIPRKSPRNDPKHLRRRQPRTRVTDKNFYSREVGWFSALFLVFCFCFRTLRNCFFLTGLSYRLAGDIAWSGR